jgi:tetratricopeptide (TPR) repeat protein
VRLIQLGKLDEARPLLEQVKTTLIEAKDELNLAIIIRWISDIDAAQGRPDDAIAGYEEACRLATSRGADRDIAVFRGQIADILQARGDLDEALRIRQEEQLPVYERLGDVHSRTATMGKIADILQARGDLDEALRIRQEEQLPVYERLGDVAGIIAVKLKTARIAVAKDIADQETFDRAIEDLSQAYRLAKQLTRLDAICATADELGSLLAAAGENEPARALLTEAWDGYRKLGLAPHVARAEARLAQRPPPGEG